MTGSWERRAIVRWLRRHAIPILLSGRDAYARGDLSHFQCCAAGVSTIVIIADAIERGEHLRNFL